MDESRGSAAGQHPLDDAAREHIGRRVKEGASREAIVQELIQRGYDARVARDMVGGVSRKVSLSARKAGLVYLIVGILVTAVFLGSTIASYSTAAEQGGTYYIFCGLILLGIYLTVRGILQLTRGRVVK
jgi:hypothetical protein